LRRRDGGRRRANAQAPAKQEVRIGYQKYGTLTLLKGRGTLEQRLRSATSPSSGPSSRPARSCWKG
jgi:hypothetical protein